MEASIRELRARLSEYIRRVQAGETVTISIHKRPVAKIVPLKEEAELSDLLDTPGILWNGKKPARMKRREAIQEGVLLSDWVAEDRR
jgi:prevent-host-death family protein